MDAYDAIVIGGGIAGVSVAYELARDRHVVLLEMEPALATHTTGRSAAMFLESYGGPAVRALTTASRKFLEAPPDGFDRPLVTPRGLLWVAAEAGVAALRALESEVRALVPSVRLLSPTEALAHCPLLREEFVALALLEPDAREVDVHALHHGYVRGLRSRGGTVRTSAPVRTLDRARGVWTALDRHGSSLQAPVVVNAAGAWCDEVAACAGVRGIRIEPLRRSLFTIAAPNDLGDVRGLPLVTDVEHTFYVKPEGEQLLCSPADETPSEPCDARPGELEIARALDRIREVTVLDPRHVRASWAGLRSFAPDRSPVAGYDTQAEGFFWLAGQGGYGIQTAPSLARAAAALIDGKPLPDDLAARGLTAEALGPARLDELSPGGHRAR
jgi:D-arginine dehydrogenase